jgi:hypothetical protein
MRGDLGLFEIGLLTCDHVLVQIEICRCHDFEVYFLLVSPLFHINVGLDTVLLFFGLVDIMLRSRSVKYSVYMILASSIGPPYLDFLVTQYFVGSTTH